MSPGMFWLHYPHFLRKENKPNFSMWFKPLQYNFVCENTRKFQLQELRVKLKYLCKKT